MLYWEVGCHSVIRYNLSLNKQSWDEFWWYTFIVVVGAEEDAAAVGTEEDAAAGGAEEDTAAGGAEEDAAAGGAVEDAAAGGAVEDAAAGGAVEDAAAGGAEEDAAAVGTEEEDATGGGSLGDVVHGPEEVEEVEAELMLCGPQSKHHSTEMLVPGPWPFPNKFSQCSEMEWEKEKFFHKCLKIFANLLQWGCLYMYIYLLNTILWSPSNYC